jgi:hypothetical protein
MPNAPAPGLAPVRHTGAMKARSLVTLALAFLTVVGCGGESSAATLGGTLSYVRSGGLAGETDELTIQRDGRAKVTTDRGGAQSFKLTASEREKIAKLVKEADLATLKVRKTPPVPDGYAYEIAYGTRKVSFESNATPQRVKKLVTALGEIVAKHRKP